MSSSSSSRSLTVIVAATASNGIGLNGGLPWRLPEEMKYFARVTTGSASTEHPNAVVMGRKTWESIPPKFRPLKGRKNLVISRSGSVDGVSTSLDTSLHSSLSSAIDALPPSPSRAFLIGGSQLYNQALSEDAASLSSSSVVDRILLTRIEAPVFECDAFLHEFRELKNPDGRVAWRKASHEELVAWVGFDVEERKEEKGVKYGFEMWLRN